MYKKYLKILIVFFVFAAALGAAHLASATAIDLGISYASGTGLANTDPRAMIARIIQIFLGLLGIITIVLIVVAGFLWMTAGGNEEQVDNAKKILINAVIGLLIILASFAIATFVLNSLLAAIGTGNNNGGNNGGGGNSGINGAGAIGECSVQTVYPIPSQTGVPKNTAIIVTFKEAINPLSICASAPCLAPTPINTTNVQIYQASNIANPLIDTQVVATPDYKTFTFVPAKYLDGSDLNGGIPYFVNLTSDVKLASGAGAFDGVGCSGSLNWYFQVSDKIDLTPPQVVSYGIFPPPDNIQDTPNVVLPTQAKGSITVVSQPKYFIAASATVAPTLPLSPTPPATVIVNPNADSAATLHVVVSQDVNGFKAALTSATGVGLTSAYFVGNTVEFSGKYPFSLTSSQNLSSGWGWTVNITAFQPADYLTVGSYVYTFVQTSSGGDQIAVGATPAATAQNIATALGNQGGIIITVAANKVTVSAAQAGAGGNNIVLDSNVPAATLNIVDMTGGADGSNNPTVNGLPDQAMNTVIQINFNEPVLPTTVVGSSAQVNAIQVIDLATNNVVSGKFVISNLYQTVEFISDNQCGMNGCGEAIYCLPPNSHLAVRVKAASLVPCSNSTDCIAKTPFTNCNSICQKSTGENYPLSQIPVTNGVADVAFNSLDGNRNSNAQGPISYYNENAPVPTAGDNYEWSFYVSDQLDTTAPFVLSTLPNNSQVALLNQDIKINFNKLMMVSSLITGSTVSDNGQAKISHKNINLWNAANNPVGYWIQTETTFSGNVPNTTNAFIKHGNFGESSSYKAQAGSGVRDIHQNCFKPSGDQSACVGVSQTMPSCCDGVPTAALDANGNCP
jgi:hypothetical protein